MLYCPRIAVEHRPSEHGRRSTPEIVALTLRNRLAYARRNLPWVAAVPHAIVWGLRTMREARTAGPLRTWRAAWIDGMRFPVQRDPLTLRQALHLHRVGGRVLW